MNTNPKHAPDNPTPRILTWLTPQVRRWLYGILTALIPLLVVYGQVESDAAALWLALGASVLGTGTALAHTPGSSE
ncbi:hypothetical protein [Schaalia sp. ZJ1691]|uniref:phage holin n=1 Tax=Schaalia sp. ZJ1691 TaxID=2709404 RepID=UPI0013EB6170|nr:hypothetical protein [Schaalia sp. ZJ1691]